MLENVTQYPDSRFLDKVLRWELIYRICDELRQLFLPTPFGEDMKIIEEETAVNLFVRAVRR
ncbi:MAG: hypothetical protein CSA34_01630 [Desulfobulbus propionicus]|nr:MAG: hypothetical protein CSA34_01630 [Desulfobulbus propionicus]